MSDQSVRDAPRAGYDVPSIDLKVLYSDASSHKEVNRSCTVATVRLLSRAITKLTLERTCLAQPRGVSIHSYHQDQKFDGNSLTSVPKGHGCDVW